MATAKSASKKSRKASPKLRAGDLTLDIEERCVIKQGVSQHLTFKECALLEIFIRNNGEVLTRKRLMKEVWDTDYLGDTRTLDVHIRWLRIKIEDKPSEPVLIRTVRGVGYRFEAAGKKTRRSKRKG
jgi:two-component system response regulator RegX3